VFMDIIKIHPVYNEQLISIFVFAKHYGDQIKQTDGTDIQHAQIRRAC
jgi:hypothetical protein